MRNRRKMCETIAHIYILETFRYFHCENITLIKFLSRLKFVIFYFHQRKSSWPTSSLTYSLVSSPSRPRPSHFSHLQNSHQLESLISSACPQGSLLPPTLVYSYLCVRLFVCKEYVVQPVFEKVSRYESESIPGPVARKYFRNVKPIPPKMFMACPATLTGWKTTPPNMKNPRSVWRIDLPTPT